MTRDELRVDDEVIWRSRYTGAQTQCSFRGETLVNGKAVLWTGRTQVEVPFEDIVSKVKE